ncbi:hypothetical protein L0P50_07410 [Lawsonibacter sp. DFI.6.74]|nr:hypothetical protein [Lawsonibacter sp. DFI.6.74]MCG4773238.1 hypothetical protein [Lawsonibacter sp. DFI.5.51]
MKNDTLGLYGPEDSRYLNLVARRAEEYGLKIAPVVGPSLCCAAYVADTDAGWPLWDLAPEEDVDNIRHTGLSCCAAGMLRHIYSSPGWRVCIIGRGHAVQGLAEALRGYEVDWCSSTALSSPERAALQNCRAFFGVHCFSTQLPHCLDGQKDRLTACVCCHQEPLTGCLPDHWTK